MSYYPAVVASASSSSSGFVSPPIPLAQFHPSSSSSNMHSLSAAFAAAAPYSSSSSYGREYASAPPSSHALTSSSLDQSIVYRGVYHAQEPTMFQQPMMNNQQANVWQQAGYPQTQMSKKIELPTLSLVSSPLPATATFSPAAVVLDLPSCPSHVERFTSFYSSANPALITKSIRLGFQQVTELRVDFNEEQGKAKFRGVCYTDDGESIQFITRVYRTASSAPAPYLVEFQRRCGDSVSFFRLFQKLVRACAHIHHAPFESSFPLPSMAMNQSTSVPMTALAYTTTGSVSVPLPGQFAQINLDAPTAQCLQRMVSSDCVEVQREASKALLQVSKHSDLFVAPPPALERSVSVPVSVAAAAEASTAMWFALVNLLSSTDSECARLGASILRNCLRRNQAAMLIAHLEKDLPLVDHLASKLAEPIQVSDDQEADAFAQREIRRQVAAVLTVLKEKKGNAFMQAISPALPALLAQYNAQQ